MALLQRLEFLLGKSLKEGNNKSYTMEIPKKEIPILFEEQCSVENFRKNIQTRHMPAVLRGLSIGNCVELWKSPEYLLSKIPNKDVKIHVSTNPKQMDFRTKNFKYCVCGLHDLILSASESPEKPNKFYIDPNEKYYLRSTGDDPRGKDTVLFDRDYPELSADFFLPKFFDEESLFSSVLRVSSADIRVWTHYDVMDNLYVQIVGNKKAVMWAPSEALNLYLDGDKSRVIDIENIEKISKDFPNFFKAEQWIGDLIPGDILYIPALWFHNMTAKDYGLAINVFWKNLNSELYDKKDPYGNKDLLPASKSLRMLDNVIRQLEDLPTDYKDFYGRQLISKIEKKCLQKPI